MPDINDDRESSGEAGRVDVGAADDEADLLIGLRHITAALPLAALQSRQYVPRTDEKVCLIICGANLDPATLA